MNCLQVFGHSVVKCSESLSNRVSKIIRKYIDNMKFAAYMVFRLSHSFTFFCFIFYSMFCMLLFNFFKLCIFIVMFMYSYCYVCSVLYILFSLCCSMYCSCVNVYCSTAIGCQHN